MIMSGELVGRVLGRHEIVALVGEGGMGAVYQARDKTLQRDIAVKVMHSFYARQPDFRRRFQREARTAARLTHPGIAQVYDVGEEAHALYIVMEYIPGPNLRMMMQTLQTDGRFVVLVEALRVVQELAMTLHYAHRRRVLHRDIKPGNILIRPEPSATLPFQPVLTDLGLARLLEGEVATQGLTMGTPAYMSPEQALGEETDVRSEVYSLGILLYELTTNKLPFYIRSIPDAIEKHVNEPVPSPLTYRPDIPPSVVHIINTALAKAPAGRYQTARDMGHALSAVAAGLITHPGLVPAVSLTTCYPGLDKATTDRMELALPLPAQDQLTVHFPDQTTQQLPIQHTPFTIGRDINTKGLVVRHETVSRNHATLDFDGKYYFVTDLSSTNGTFLASRQLTPGIPERWPPGTPLFVGQCRILLARKELAIQEEARKRIKDTSPHWLMPEPITDTQVVVDLPSSELQTAPGRRLDIPLTLLNQSRLIDHFALNVTGIPAGWVTTPSPSQILPTEQVELTLTIQPPNATQSRAGDYPFTIQVNSQALRRTVGLATGLLRVTAQPQLTLDLQPSQQRGASAGRFVAQLHNQGNADLFVSLAGSDEQDLCMFVFERATVALPAGQTQQVDLTVRRRDNQPSQHDHAHAFVVTARPEDLPQLVRQATGEWVHVPGQLTLTLDPPEQRSVQSGKFRVAISNPDDRPVVVRLSGRDPAGLCAYHFSPDECVVPAGQQQYADLTIEPNDPFPAQTEDTHHFTLTALVDEASYTTTGQWTHIVPHFRVALRNDRPEGTVSGLFVVQLYNDSAEDLTFQLVAQDGNGVCEFTFANPSVTVEKGQMGKVQMQVKQQGEALTTSRTTHPFTIAVRPLATPEAVKQVQGEWRQTTPAFVLRLRPEKDRGMTDGAYMVELDNREAFEMAFDVSAVDPKGMCELILSGKRGTVQAGKKGKLPLQVQRRQLTAQPRPFAFKVTAAVFGHPQIQQQVTGRWMQLPPAFSLQLLTQNQPSIHWGVFHVQVHNPLAVPLVMGFRASDPAGLCEYQFSAGQVRVPAGQTSQTQLTIRPRSPLHGTQSRVYGFTVLAQLLETPTVTQEVLGRWTQVPAALRLELMPTSHKGRKSGRYVVRLTSQCEVDLQVKLAGADKAQALRFSLGQEEVLLPAGQAISIPLTVQADSATPTAQTYPFSVIATLPQIPNFIEHTNGKWEQLPRRRFGL